MKNYFIFILFAFFISFSCNKKESEEINVNGVIKDIRKNAMDSIKVTLKETCFGCTGDLPISRYYSNDTGYYSLIISPKDDKSYYLLFEKEGFIRADKGIDNDKSSQIINLIMESDTINY